MAQSNADLAYRDFDVFWAGSSLEPPVSWEEFIQSFQLIVVAKEEIDIEDLLQDNPNNCPTILVRLWKSELEKRINRQERIGRREMQRQ